ncbi:hypothetical protein ACLOJK_004025 [Asimina triloba]
MDARQSAMVEFPATGLSCCQNLRSGFVDRKRGFDDAFDEKGRSAILLSVGKEGEGQSSPLSWLDFHGHRTMELWVHRSLISETVGDDKEEDAVDSIRSAGAQLNLRKNGHAGSGS